MVILSFFLSLNSNHSNNLENTMPKSMPAPEPTPELTIAKWRAIVIALYDVAEDAAHIASKANRFGTPEDAAVCNAEYDAARHIFRLCDDKLAALTA